MAMLGALISAGGSVAGVLVKPVGKPVGRQFGYVFHRQKYIEDLREQVQNLEAHKKDVDDLIDEAKRDRKEILQTVENWIERVDRFIVEAKEFREGGTNVNQKCLNGWFPDLVTRRRLGKEAKNKAEEAKELGEKGKFNGISKTARPLGMESIPSKQLAPYASTNLTMTNVMEALIDDKINFIGIHGIGGVGKTTLVKEIGKKAKSDKLFDEVVMAEVSQNQDIEKIQDGIAGMLGFTSLINQRSKTEREGMLCERLKDVKKILVILDDVWDKLDLAAVGIPFGNDHQGCKIIITTRREQVCNSMGMERLRTKIVHLDVLSKEDSWDLFKKNVGDVLDSDVLNVVANKVCKECGGLPIALVTVGSAMKGKDDPTLWDEADRELRISMPTNIEGVDQCVYKCLKLSFDYLQDEEAKACFLLCSLFPEDHNILIEDLVRYGMGLRIFKKVDTVHEARGRAKSVIVNLIASCLLLASDNKQDCIKMHDVVRDVAIDIGSKEHFVRAGCNLKDWPNMDSLDQYTGISLMENQISNLPQVLECPKLQILLLQENENAWSCSHEFFSRMNALSVLDLSQRLDYDFSYLFESDFDSPICSPDAFNDFGNPIRSPDAFKNQTCLRTLVLDRIKFGDTKFLGQLKTLEVLSLRHAFFFEAPNAIKELTNLRLLDMTESRHEFLIPAAMVSPLSHLEELYLFGSTYSGRRIGYPGPTVEVAAALRSWPRLKVLTISIHDIAYIPKDFVFPELESFIIFLGKSYDGVRVENYSPNYLGLANLVGTMVNWSKWLKMVLKRATYLKINNCSELEYLINTEEWGISSQAQPRDLQLLFNPEVLKLFGLNSFKGICAASALTTSSRVYFPKLRILQVNRCPSLSTVLLPFNLLQRLQHLEKLAVAKCKNLKQVFDFGSEGEGMKLLSSLTRLRLNKLPRLKHILNCSSRQHVQLCNLTYLYVSSCGKLKYVFQPSIAQALHQLEFLCVNTCEEMEEIVAAKQNEGQQEEEERVDYKMVFKSLKELHLQYLPNLSGFCTGGDDFPFEWPSLERLVLQNCPKMKTFAATTYGSTPKLKEVELDTGFVIPLQGMDLNQFVQTHIISKSPKLESIPLMAQGVWSEDPAVQIEATTQFRKLLSIERSPPIDEVIKAGVVPRFVEFLGRRDLPKLQFEAAWALANVASGTSKHTQVVIEHGAVPMFVLLLSSASDDVRERAVWALGNVAGASPSCRDLVLGNGALMPLLAQLNKHSKLSMLRNATRTLSKFCWGKPPTPSEQVKPALPVLRQLIHLNDEVVLTNACWALSYLSDGPNDKIQAVIEAGVCPRLVELLPHPSPTVLITALRTVGNIVRGDDTQTQLESIPLMAQGVWSEDPAVQIEATTQFRKLLSIERSPPIDEVIKAGVVPWFVEFLGRQDLPILQFEAAWALTNVASGTSEHTRVVIEHGAVPKFVLLLSSASDDVRERAVWALGKVAGASPSCRDLVLGNGALMPLLAQLNEHSKLSTLRNATWTLFNFCQGKPPTPFEQVKPALPVLRQLIHLNDEEVLSNACWALSYLSDGPNDKIQAVIEAGVCPRLVELLLHPSPTVLITALRTVGNIVRGDDTQTQFVIENHVLPCLYQLLTQNHEKRIKKGACWTISNITAGNRSQIQAVIEANIILPLVRLLQHAEFNIKKKAAWAISNATSGGSHDQIRFLASQGCIKPLCDLLICPDPRIVTVCLEGLENILMVGEADKEGGMNNGINLYAQTIDESDGLDKIENLQTHDNNEIHEKAVKILEILHRGG